MNTTDKKHSIRAYSAYAMQGLLSDSNYAWKTPNEVASTAVDMAEALVKELMKRQEDKDEFYKGC